MTRPCEDSGIFAGPDLQRRVRETDFSRAVIGGQRRGFSLRLS
jgi:hypothetical protein